MEILIFLVIFGFGIAIGFVITDGIWLIKFNKKLMKAIEEYKPHIRYPDDLIELAKEYFGKDWYKAIKECDNSHMLEDCVLCGRE